MTLNALKLSLCGVALCATALVTPNSAHAFGFDLVANAVKEQVKESVKEAASEAVTAGVAAATSGTAMQGVATTAAGAAANMAANGQGEALGQAMSSDVLTGGGKAFILGNVLAGEAVKAAQNNAKDADIEPAAGSSAGVPYTLKGKDTDTSVAAGALQQAMALCNGNGECMTCVSDDFKVQMSDVVGKPGKRVLGAKCGLGGTKKEASKSDIQWN